MCQTSERTDCGNQEGKGRSACSLCGIIKLVINVIFLCNAILLRLFIQKLQMLFAGINRCFRGEEMKIILMQDVDKLGDKGSVMEVKDGYARNFLIPNNLAIIASKGNLKTWENERVNRERKEQKEKDNAKKLADNLSKHKFSIKAKCGEEGKLFGSVTALDIARIIEEQAKIQIDKKKIEIEDAIKNTGEYKIGVKMIKGIIAEINLEVIPE